MVKKVLFVCLGNICRSPSAEAVFRQRASELFWNIEFDSAGTIATHSGERSDPRSILHAALRGFEMTHLARQIVPEDFEKHDLILVMDQSNYRDVCGICPREHSAKVKLLTDYCEDGFYDNVPDPYYGSSADFELVLDIIEEAWAGFQGTYFPSAKPT
jgi:protein-tyrosine phosphatase